MREAAHTGLLRIPVCELSPTCDQPMRARGRTRLKLVRLSRVLDAAVFRAPWSAGGVRFDEAAKVLTVVIDYAAGSRFAVQGAAGEHPVYDSPSKRYRAPELLRARVRAGSAHLRCQISVRVADGRTACT